VTYGTEYGDDVWPLQRGEWSDSSFRPAVFAWVPSIGISNLIEVRKGPLAAWVGDLLVASLDGRSLFRVRREGGRVVYVEPIQVGSRIRDLVEGPDGRIVLMADGGTIIRLEAETSGGGEALFARCLGCHSTEAGAGSAIGPSLHRIYSRRIAADAGFNYSPALRSVSGRWSASNLDAFLADPQAFAPGTIMELEPMTDPAERATLIEFLKTIR
jgi:cytochrome c2